MTLPNRPTFTPSLKALSAIALAIALTSMPMHGARSDDTRLNSMVGPLCAGQAEYARWAAEQHYLGLSWNLIIGRMAAMFAVNRQITGVAADPTLDIANAQFITRVVRGGFYKIPGASPEDISAYFLPICTLFWTGMNEEVERRSKQ